MKKTTSLMLLIFLLCTFSLSAQLITTTPTVLQENSQNVSIVFKASEGDLGLKGSDNCYAHTGVITNKSTSDTDWKYAPTWGDNSTKYKLTLAGTNKWKLTIGDIRTYYGITDPTEKILKLAFVFRNSDCSKTGRAADGGDILVEVHEAGLAMSFTSNPSLSVIGADKSKVTFSVNTTQAANIKLFLNNTSTTPIASVDGATTLSHLNDFTTVGDYNMIAQAEANGQTLLDTISICRRGESQLHNYSGTLKQGATANPDGTVTFCLLAPQKSNVMLVGEWNGYKPSNSTLMNYQGDKYFWTTVSGLDFNKEYGYYFIVDDNIIVADPYAKLILDPWNDKYINEKTLIYPNLKPFPTQVGNNIIAVFKGNKYNYPWSIDKFNKPAKENLIIYEMLLRDFTDNKSLNAAIEKLDYINGLGVNAIELMPIQEFSGNNSWGYNPSFYFAPDKAYGDPQTYKKFVDECHKRGIAVILDVVFNHVWGDHPWCKMYWDATNSRPSTANPFLNAVAPHDFSVGNDWKQENTNVQNYFGDVLKYWMEEYKIDGYRFDLVKGLGDSNSYSGNYSGDNYNQSRINNTKRLIDAIHSVDPNGYAIFEAFVNNSEEVVYGTNGAMSWRKMCGPAQQMLGGYTSGSSFAGMNDASHYWVGFMESHDEERNTYWANNYASSGIKGNLATTMRRLGSNAALAFLSPGAKMMWQFEEMGYDESIDSNGGRTDPKPTHWEYLENTDRKGLVDSYSDIINIRTANPDLFDSQASFTETYSAVNWSNGLFITSRNSTRSKELVVAVNPNQSDATYSYTFDNPAGKYYMNSHSYGVNPTFNASTSTITVPANSYVIISNMDPSGVEDVIADSDKYNVNIYPNPATDFISVDADNIIDVEVYSLTGAMVAKSNASTVDVSNLATGNYIVKVITENSVATSKLIKK